LAISLSYITPTPRGRHGERASRGRDVRTAGGSSHRRLAERRVVAERGLHAVHAPAVWRNGRRRDVRFCRGRFSLPVLISSNLV
jgi:hypothetical protein